MTKRLVVIGSNSIHSKRFIQGLLTHSDYELSIISNSLMPEFDQVQQYIINFALTNVKAKGQISQILRQISPHIVHIHQANSYAWHSLRAIKQLTWRPRTILSAWGSDVLLLPKTSRVLARIVRYNLQHADVITSDSLFMSGVIKQLLGPINKPIHTINFGIQELPTPQDFKFKHNMILSNRFHKPLYQIDKIISAFAYLRNNKLLDASWQLVIAASGEESDKLKQLSALLGIHDSIVFSGMLTFTELVEYYRRAKIFVSVPSSDGTASSLLEAMAYGCIPVLSNVPANLEWVINEYNGYIAPNVDNLADQLLAAINHTNNKLAYQQTYAVNYHLIMAKASLNHNIHKFISLYQ